MICERRCLGVLTDLDGVVVTTFGVDEAGEGVAGGFAEVGWNGTGAGAMKRSESNGATAGESPSGGADIKGAGVGGWTKIGAAERGGGGLKACSSSPVNDRTFAKRFFGSFSS